MHNSDPCFGAALPYIWVWMVQICVRIGWLWVIFFYKKWALRLVFSLVRSLIWHTRKICSSAHASTFKTIRVTWNDDERNILGWMPWQKATKKCNYYTRNHIIQSQMLWKKCSIIICHFPWRRHSSTKTILKYQKGGSHLSGNSFYL